MENFLVAIRSFFEKSKKLAVTLGILFLILIIVFVGLIVLLIFNYANTKSTFGSELFAPAGVVSSNSYKSLPRESLVADQAIRSTYPVPGEVPASSPNVPTEKKIIRNGSLDLLVKNAEDSLKKITDIASLNGGFIESSYIYEVSEGVKSGSVVLRVPSKNFDTTISALKQIAVKVQREETNSRDVTAEYVDLEAQIKNYRAEEKQYLEIMNRAVKIEDVLNVASRLSDVRGRIERTQGQLNYLARQVDMSTISVSLTAEPEVRVLGIVWRPLTVLKQSVKTFLSDLTNFVDWLVRLIFKIPVYLLKIGVIAFLLFFIWKLLVWTKRRFF
jgi:hypothetical protein